MTKRWQYQQDTWLEDMLGREVLRADLLSLENAQGGLKATELVGAIKTGGFIYAKLPLTELQAVRLMESVGFRLAEVSLYLEKTSQTPANARNLEAVRFARPKDEEAVRSIADQAFTWSRFHQDPLIGSKAADRIKAAWAGNYFRGLRGDHMVVAESENEVVGFLQLLHNDDDLVIDLIAVHPGCQGKGLGKAMIAYAETNCPDYKSLKVGTQAVNQLSLGVYQSLGMKVVGGAYVLHYHSGQKK